MNNTCENIELAHLPPLPAVPATNAGDPLGGDNVDQNLESALLTSLPSPTSTFNISDAPGDDHGEEAVGKPSSDAVSPLLASSAIDSNEAEPSTRPKTSLEYLQRIAELCEKILESNLRRENNRVLDSESEISGKDQVPEHDRTVGFRKTVKTPLEEIKVKAWKYEQIRVLTEDEMKATSFWEDKASATLLDNNYASALQEWIGDAAVDSPLRKWLLPLLGLLSIGLVKEPLILARNLASRNYALLICDRLDGRIEFLLRMYNLLDSHIIPAKIIIVIITMHTQETLSLKSFTIGVILAECYRKGLLKQPMYNHMHRSDHVDNHIDHFHLVTVLFLVLVTEYRQIMLEDVIYFRFVPLKLLALGYEKMMGLTLYDILRACSHNYLTEPSDRATGLTFRADDLDVASLRSLGRLHVMWTACLEKHLFLNIQTRTISICWFPAKIDSEKLPWLGQGLNETYMAKWYRRIVVLYCRSLSQRKVHEQMTQTYAFLFAAGSFKRDPRVLYESMPRPYWIPGDYPIVCAQDLKRGKKDRSASQPEVIDHIAACKAAGESRESLLVYSDFPSFEPRLRELRAYMDSCRPTGLRQLWRDKRDTLNYYTFWGVIIFGFTSVLLALLSLAVSTAQTVASFKALDSTSA